MFCDKPAGSPVNMNMILCPPRVLGVSHKRPRHGAAGGGWVPFAGGGACPAVERPFGWETSHPAEGAAGGVAWEVTLIPPLVMSAGYTFAQPPALSAFMP